MKSLLENRFAVFQDKNCIYEFGINNPHVLDSFIKQFWENDPLDRVVFHFFRGLVFPSFKFCDTTSTYMITTMVTESETDSWTDNNWQLLAEKLHVSAFSLTHTSNHEFQKLNHKFSSYQHVESLQEEILPEESNDFSDNYQFEKNFIQQLKSADSLVLSKLLYNLSSVNQTSLSDDKLLEKKYRLVSMITLITRAAIEDGSPAADSYRLSDKLIRNLDKSKNLSDLEVFSKKMVQEFSLFIRKNSIPHASLLIKNTVNYINSHLYENLTNGDIAEYVSVNPSYLSSQFKKQMGVPLRYFVTKARINEAKYLLTDTDLSFKEISESLHFSNQSHFCKLFKKHTSYTPKEFKTLF